MHRFKHISFNLARRSFIAGLLSTLLLACQFPLAAKQKVILDTDMVELFDDGIAMVMLANSAEIDLMGVVTTSGNVWAREATAYTLRQLEIINKRDIPVYQGIRHPLRPGRYETMKQEQALFGKLDWCGALGRPEPPSYMKLAADRIPYGGYPSLKPQTIHGVRFLIDTIMANPGEVTVLAIGPLANIAVAMRMEPRIIKKVKGIVYMGGAFDVPGNITPAAEFNWWFDPEAAKMAVRAPFPEQVVVGLDVCDKYTFDEKLFKRIIAVKTPLTDFFKEKYGPRFRKNPAYTRLVWDTIAAAIVIQPDLVTEEETRWIDVNESFTPDYGRSLGYKKHGPAGTQKARIIFSIDEKRFRDLMVTLVTR